MDQLPAVLVSDRARWIQDAGQACRAISAIPEHETWKSAAGRTEPGSALVLDVTNPFDPKRDQLRRWARRAWQPLCVLCVSPQRGATELMSWASRVGYRYTVHGDALKEYCADLDTHLRNLIENCVWLVPELAAKFECHSPPIVDALAEACLMIPRHTTVDYWARELGLPGRRNLEELFACHDLPKPKIVLDWLRLLRAVEHGVAEREATRGELAKAFGYASGKYLGRRAQQLTGQPLCKLLEMGAKGTLRLLATNERGPQRPGPTRGK